MRLFIAIDLPDDVKYDLYMTSTELIRQSGSGRVIPLENYHITLVFIGDTKDKGRGGSGSESERVATIERVVSDACRRYVTSPLTLSINGVGSFKGYKGYNWWVGVKENRTLTVLADYMTEELKARGFNIEHRNFKPHITIGRSIENKCPIALEAPQTDIEVTKISLMRSDRKEDRQVYTEIFVEDLR